jgi:site-specific recombinase XerD
MLDSLKSDRDRAIVVLGFRTGFRISELLSLEVNQVVEYGKIRDSITVSRSHMKGKHQGRTVVLHQDAKKALEKMGVLTMRSELKLFPICRMQASRIIKNAKNDAQVMGKVSSHSFRKTFTKKVHEKFGKDITKTQKALGHKNLSSTIHYLQFDQEEIDNVILSA